MSILTDADIKKRCTVPTFVLVTNVPAKNDSGFDVYIYPQAVESFSYLSEQEISRLVDNNITRQHNIFQREQYIGPITYRGLTRDEKDSFRPMISPYVEGQVRTALRTPTGEEIKRWDAIRNGGDIPPGFICNNVDVGLQIEEKIISYGTSSCGYDVRLADEFKIFTNINNTIIDPLNFDDNCLHDHKGPFCIVPPNSYILGRTIEYFDIPRDVMVVCVGKSTYARCFTGDTQISLADGSNPTFIELIERFNKGEKIWGYSVDNNLNIVMSELTLPRKIGNEKIIEVILDNNESIKCTPDHKFITREGLEVEAKDLQSGDSLFPLYKVVTPKGYETIAQPLTWTYDFVHKLADDWNIRNNIYKSKLEESARHHLDHNKLNNVPSNIVRMTPSDHTKYHNDINRHDESIKNKISIGNKKNWEENSKDENWLEKQLKHLRHMTSLWMDKSNVVARQRHATKVKEYWDSEKGLEAREIARQRFRATASTEEFKRRSSESLKNLWKDPDYREMMSKVISETHSRKDITEDELKKALEIEGSIRGTARRLNCDRSVFRRFSDTIAFYKEKWEAAKITVDQFYDAMCKYGSATDAAKTLNISKSTVHRHFKEAVNRFYGSPIEDNHKVLSVKDLDIIEDVYCLTTSEFGNFALSKGVFVNNCGAIVNVTPIEPGFKGNIVIEISNSTSLPLKIYANQGISQFLFFKSEQPCSVSYADGNRKYQGQTGITTAKV